MTNQTGGDSAVTPRAMPWQVGSMFRHVPERDLSAARHLLWSTPVWDDAAATESNVPERLLGDASFRGGAMWAAHDVLLSYCLSQDAPEGDEEVLAVPAEPWDGFDLVTMIGDVGRSCYHAAPKSLRSPRFLASLYPLGTQPGASPPPSSKRRRPPPAQPVGLAALHAVVGPTAEDVAAQEAHQAWVSREDAIAAGVWWACRDIVSAYLSARESTEEWQSQMGARRPLREAILEVVGDGEMLPSGIRRELWVDPRFGMQASAAEVGEALGDLLSENIVMSLPQDDGTRRYTRRRDLHVGPQSPTT